GDRADGVSVPFGGADLAAVFRVPPAQRLVAASGKDVLPIRAVHGGSHRQRVLRERLGCRAAVHVPDAYALIGTGGDDVLAVGAEHRGPHDIGVALEGSAALVVAAEIPDADRLIRACRGELAAVRVEGDRFDVLGV